MDKITLLHIFFSALFICKVSSTDIFPIGDPRTCDIEAKPKYRFESLPGLGWDNLVNENRGIVVNFNYSKCKTTDDRLYLIPDGIFTIPIKSSRMNVFSKMYEHWSEYETDTAYSFNIDGSVSKGDIKISGSFSREYKQVKSHQIEDKSLTTKVQARYVRYTAKLLTDVPLDPRFRSRLLKIANHLQNSRKASARYESELLVRDFGTHVTTTIQAGASIVKVDQIKSSLLQDNTLDKSSIALAASFSFPIFDSFELSGKYSRSRNDTNIDKYMKHLTDSDIRTYGGPALTPENFTLGSWVSEIDNDLVTIDRNGSPLDHFITITAFPELSESLVHELSQSIKSAIKTYYKHNTYLGCTNTDAPNFSYIANADDGTCHAPLTNLSFGGVFQKCEFEGELINNENLCETFGTKNPKTQEYSCPNGYDQILLYSSETSKSQHKRECHTCWIFASCCHDNKYHGKAKFTSYWCQAEKNSTVPQNGGYLFGGLFSDKTHNVVTQSQTCPQFYLPLAFTSNVYVCVSDDYELGTGSSIPFGGFYSCSQGNPMASVKEVLKSCPHGYSNHVATIDNQCEIMYCTNTKSLSHLKLPNLQLPPFTNIPAESIESVANYIISHDGESWLQLIDPATKNRNPKEDKWTTVKSAPSEMGSLIKKFDSNHVKDPANDEMSRADVVGLSVGLTTVVCLIVGVVVIIIRDRQNSVAVQSQEI